MGTTLAALQAGSTNYVYVAAIEGCPYLLTNGSTSAALTAWSGTDWTQALGGLFVEIRDEQRLNPNEPFTSGGTCTLHVAQGVADTFGILTARRFGGSRTYLTATLDRDDTTASVKSTANFDAAGEVHIGTECIEHTGKTSTTLTGLVRGKYSPFGAQSQTWFAHHHRVGLDSQSINLQPAVSTIPRVWAGRWVGVWMHRVVGDVLDVKAQAHLVFAGRIDEMADDPNTFARVIHCTPVLDVLKESVIGQSLWEGTCEDGIYLSAGMAFEFGDSTSTIGGSAVPKTATSLSVVSGTPSTNEIAEGWYTLSDVCSELSAWLTAERAASRLTGNYQIASPVSIPGGQLRTKIYYTLTGDLVLWVFGMPRLVADFLGFDRFTSASANTVKISHSVPGTDLHYYQDREPQRLAIGMYGDASSTTRITTTSGDIADQYTYLPSSIKPAFSSGEQWGIFIINDKRMVLAEISTAGTLKYIQPAFPQNKDIAAERTSVVVSVYDSGSVRVRQIFAFEGPVDIVTYRLLLSTGTAGYNHSLLDAYPFGAGADIPYDLVSGVIDTAPGVPNIGAPVTLFIDKPITVSELIRSDLIMRWAFFYWQNGTLKMGSWRSPVAALASVTLAETNKAAPSGSEENHRAAAVESREWYAPISVIRYNRDISDPQGDAYQDTLKLVDRGAIDDAAGEGGIRSLSLRNTYRSVSGVGQSVDDLATNYLTLVPLISRPANLITRSVDFRYAFQIAVGDIVLLSDKFARDPQTGQREITSRPAMIVRVGFSPGGFLPGSDEPLLPVGEVDLFFADVDTERAGIAYVPSADIDDTADSGGFSSGYNSSTKTLRCYAHRFSESSESSDATHLLPGDKVRIMERDPLDPSDPDYWDDTVASQSGDDVTLTTGLSSPAWDADKFYRVTYQPWDSVVSAQQSKTFQADDADGLILDDADPFLYAATGADATYTANSSTEIEIVPAAVYADGFGRDVGHDAALIRAADYYVDYKSALHQPMLFNTWAGNTTTGAGDYKLIGYWPLFMSFELGSNAIYRLLTVAPWARSTDGTSTKIRVSLCRLSLNDTTLVNVNRGAVFGSVEWTGITSTTGAIQTASAAINVNVKDLFGGAYLVLECGLKCETLGLARFVVGKRNVT